MGACVAGHRNGDTSDRAQANMIMDICIKYGLVQQVDMATRPASGEILDLVFTSDQDLVSHIEAEDHLTFTDHSVLTCYTSLTPRGSTVSKEKSYLCSTDLDQTNPDSPKQL